MLIFYHQFKNDVFLKKIDDMIMNIKNIFIFFGIDRKLFGMLLLTENLSIENITQKKKLDND